MLYSDFLKQHAGECPFCDQENGRPILERPTAFLTYSLAPYHKHHMLIVPYRHIENILDLSNEEVADMEYLQERGLAILKQLGYRNLTVLEREGDATAKSIPHLHAHLIPNVRIGDLDHLSQPRVILTNDEIIALMDEFGQVLEK